MEYAKGKPIYGTTCQSCGVFTPDNLAIDVKDAKMRAASKDMYEALKFIVNPHFGGDVWLLKNYPEAYNKIMAALNKAEGKGE